MTDEVDQKYYQVVKSGSVSERLLIKARDNIYRDFIKHMMPEKGAAIVDVGISDIVTDGANFLERLYPFPSDITACGLSDAAEFRRSFPECRYKKIEPNVRLPFEDQSFDIATSNAVLEHVGSLEDQSFHIKELCRIAKQIFISVPHRYFPIEHHTLLPLLHYTDYSFRITCRVFGKAEWSDHKNLIMMTTSRLKKLTSNLDRSVTIGYTGVSLGPLSSNLFLSIV